VQSVVEVVEGGFRVELGPQELHRLLPMQPVPRGEGEHLEQASCLPQVPLLFRDVPRPHRNPEATEQPDAKRLRRSASLWGGRSPLIVLGLRLHRLDPRI
jgi:hypothetical protein